MAEPRKVSEIELKRLKKRGGVRKKLGAQPEKERLEPVAEGDKGMSGSVPPDQPAPVLPEPTPAPVSDEEGIVLTTSDDKDHTHTVKVPYAAMGVSNAARDIAFEEIMAANQQVINDFKESLALSAKPRKRVPWDHDLIRDEKTGLLKKIRSVPVEPE